MIVLKNVNKTYSTKEKGKVRALLDINISFPEKGLCLTMKKMMHSLLFMVSTISISYCLRSTSLYLQSANLHLRRELILDLL